jgi:iron complex transport system ATP-binding protein
LIASNLRLAYQRRIVVEDASLGLARGRVLALVGPNGSGKSTLLRALARLHRPERGDVNVNGVTSEDLTPRAFARLVTLLPQSRPMPGGVSVRDIVGYGRHPHRSRWGGADVGADQAITRAMDMTGVASMADRSADQLSGGELQRVWLATCLAQDTNVLLLDEPTSHLDLRYQIEILDLVRDLADHHDVAVGIVLHDLNQAAALADQLALIHEGRVVASGQPEEVLTPRHLTDVYGIPMAVTPDPITGSLTIRPLGRRDHTREREGRE